MKRYKVIAKNNMAAPPYTWTKGEIYHVTEKVDSFTITSDQGKIHYLTTVRDQVLNSEKFEPIVRGRKVC